MKKAVSARCTLVGGMLLTIVLSAFTPGPAVGQTSPSGSVAAASSSAVTPEKKKKLDQALEQGAKSFDAGRFEESENWYKAALKLEPARDDVFSRIQEASRLRELQRAELAKVPAEPKAKEKFLAKSLEVADKYYDAKQFDQAQKAYRAIWLVAGDYQGKTVQRVRECGSQLGQPVPAAPAPQQPRAVMVAAVQPAAALAPAAVPAMPAAPSAGAPSVEQAKAQASAKVASILEADDAPAAKPAAAPSAPAALGQIPPIQPVSYEQPAAAAKPVALAGTVTQEAAAGSVDDLTRLQVTQLLHSARELNAAGKVEDARRNVTKALELWPGNAEAVALQADLNKQLGYGSRDLIDSLLAEGDGLAAEGKFDQAIARYDEALKQDPANQDAAARKDAAMKKRVKLDNLNSIKDAAAKRRELDQMMTQAIKAYDAKDLKKAREIWQNILTVDPEYKAAKVYLEETKAEWARVAADETARSQAEKLSEDAEKLLNSPVSVSTESRVPLDQFLKILSFSTAVEMQYYITEGAKAQVSGNFQNKSLREVLDTVLLPIGLSWSVNNNNTIVIEQKLITKTYTLSPDKMSKVKALAASGDLQKSVWGQTEPPATGCEITLDERQNMVVVTGSKLHIQKIESLLSTMGDAEAQEMIVRIYKINEKDGPRIKSLINSIISATQGAPFDLERKIFVDKDDLIIRDTPENIKKIEELLLDKKFIQDMREDKLDIANFSLVPRDTESISDQIRAFTSRVVEAIKVFLYSQTGESKANEEGRRLWYDPYTLQLTIVDTRTNLARVGQYIEALPELGQKTRQDVIFLKFAVAEDLAASLEQILSITSGQGLGAGAAGSEAVFKLRQGEEKVWRNLRLRVIRLNDPNRQNRGGGGGGGGARRRNEGTVEFTIDTGVQIEQRSMQELSTEYVDDYRITIEDVAAAAGGTGAGSARFRISYSPQMVRNQLNSMQDQGMGAEGQGMSPEESLEETGISINPFGQLNAIILRYTNPGLYKDVLDLIAQLDKPTKQVAIETKFVEVNETRAKEFSADFNVAGLGTDASGKDRHLDWNTNRFNSRFAQDADEFRDVFGPPLENPLNANLIKGTTVFNAVIGNQDPLLTFSLRFLEAEGVLNVVNGPKVTSIDGQEAVFRIESYLPSQNQQNRNQNQLMDFINPFQNMNQLDIADVDDVTNQNMIQAVVLRCTPEITSQDSILLNELSAELLDFEGWLGDIAQPIIRQTQNQQQQNQLFTIVAPPQATTNFNQQMMVKRKRVETNARVSNGGTIILGGWTGERSEELTSGVPVLRNMPYIGKLLFSRAQRSAQKTTLLIFLTCYLVE